MVRSGARFLRRVDGLVAVRVRVGAHQSFYDSCWVFGSTEAFSVQGDIGTGNVMLKPRESLSRLDAQLVDDAEVVLEYQEVIDQLLEDQMRHVPP